MSTFSDLLTLYHMKNRKSRCNFLVFRYFYEELDFFVISPTFHQRWIEKSQPLEKFYQTVSNAHTMSLQGAEKQAARKGYLLRRDEA